ncbi:unnamed protein product [Fraxinus pennsylvanica]|uniref:Importin subunit beta-1/Transportin-1-like TPR repeats domain-containing protein n=1 Tax=Fraxinus pennsylvanica TaxID=56036 RepID=A0AAD2E523_9LAMI|nr:unnamed protein product [Fraxinus pennsylvanica]
MTELHKTLEAQKLSSDEREKQSEIQGLLCGCLQVLIQKLGASEPTKYAFMQYADQIMNLFLRVFDCPNFVKYMQAFYKYLEMGLQNFEEYQVCAVTVGVVGDICRALEDKILPYCDKIMTQLLKDLSSNQLHRSVKPPIFSCFGDIALTVGENFDQYLMFAMPMLPSAAELSAHTSGADNEMIEYTNLLRNGILEAYSGIFQGFKNSTKTQLLIPHAPHVLQFLDSIYMEKDMDDVVMKTAIGVLGDLADTLGSNAGWPLVVPFLFEAVSARYILFYLHAYGRVKLGSGIAFNMSGLFHSRESVMVASRNFLKERRSESVESGVKGGGQVLEAGEKKAGSSPNESFSSHTSVITLAAPDELKGNETGGLHELSSGNTVLKELDTQETNIALDGGDSSTRKTCLLDTDSSSHMRETLAEPMTEAAEGDPSCSSCPLKKYPASGGMTSNSMGSNTLESAILDLEELVNKVKWLKSILNNGIPSSDAARPQWKVMEHVASSSMPN